MLIKWTQICMKLEKCGLCEYFYQHDNNINSWTISPYIDYYFFLRALNIFMYFTSTILLLFIFCLFVIKKSRNMLHKFVQFYLSSFSDSIQKKFSLYSWQTYKQEEEEEDWFVKWYTNFFYLYIYVDTKLLIHILAKVSISIHWYIKERKGK